jgi:hypothetical protein
LFLCLSNLALRHEDVLGSGCIDSVFLTSALTGGEWSPSRACRFTPGERAPGTHWIGGWVDPRATLDDVEKRNFLTLSGLEVRPLGRPARSQSLYRLRYPGSLCLQDTLPNVHVTAHKIISPICILNTSTNMVPLTACGFTHSTYTRTHLYPTSSLFPHYHFSSDVQPMAMNSATNVSASYSRGPVFDLLLLPYK